MLPPALAKLPLTNAGQRIVETIISSKEYRRLKHILQLGNVSDIHTSAEHTRYAHSIGVAEKAVLVLDGVRQRQPELNISDEMVLTVCIAGLVHDLGHGPRSHVFEQYFRSHFPFCHEQMSIDLFSLIVFEYSIELPSCVKQSVEAIVKGKQELLPGPWGNCLFLIQVINSTLDVDKSDYLQRDTKALDGFLDAKPTSPGASGIGRAADNMISKLLDDLWTDVHVHEFDGCYQLCYPEDKQALLLQVLKHRRLLYEKVYYEPVSKALELMSMVLLAGTRMDDILSHQEDATKYAKLDDSIFRELEAAKASLPAEYQTLLERINNRDAWLCVGEFSVNTDDNKWFGRLKNALIAEAREIQWFDYKLDYCAKSANPIERVVWYSRANPEHTHRTCLLDDLPDSFCERYLRLYLKSGDELRACMLWKKLCATLTLVTGDAMAGVAAVELEGPHLAIQVQLRCHLNPDVWAAANDLTAPAAVSVRQCMPALPDVLDAAAASDAEESEASTIIPLSQEIPLSQDSVCNSPMNRQFPAAAWDSPMGMPVLLSQGSLCDSADQLHDSDTEPSPAKRARR